MEVAIRSLLANQERYVLDGCFAFYDGELNAGNEHVDDLDLTKWANLCGPQLLNGRYYGNRPVAYRWNSKSCQTVQPFDAAAATMAFPTSWFQNAHTVEIVHRVNCGSAFAFSVGACYPTAFRLRLENGSYVYIAGNFSSDGPLLSMAYTYDKDSNMLTGFKNGKLFNQVASRLYDSKDYGANLMGRLDISANDCELFCLRVHNRSLSLEEIAHNFTIDQRRFGI